MSEIYDVDVASDVQLKISDVELRRLVAKHLASQHRSNLMLVSQLDSECANTLAFLVTVTPAGWESLGQQCGMTHSIIAEHELLCLENVMYA